MKCRIERDFGIQEALLQENRKGFALFDELNDSDTVMFDDLSFVGCI